MTDPTAAELDAICARLTKAQREHILVSESGGWFAGGDEGLGWIFRRKSLIQIGLARPGVMFGFALTPLGVATRKRLIERMQHD